MTQDTIPPDTIVAYDLGIPRPDLRPASVRRAWMDATPEAFAYRCLPLTVANGFGWEIRVRRPFTAIWTGGIAPKDVLVSTEGGDAPIGHFGSGILTFHVHTLLRTPPGISLWVSGPPNAPKDGIHALSGLVETDWASATFTMNWRLTRPGVPVHFEAGEPYCHFFPVDRRAVTDALPEWRHINDDPDLARRHHEWSASRGAFSAALAAGDPAARNAKWQRHYHQGRHVDGTRETSHLMKASARPFQE